MPNHPLIERMNRLQVGENSLAFYGLGQVGVAIRGPGGVLYIDPYLTDSDGGGGHLERVFPPPVPPGDVTNADLVLVTHNHVDHFDPDTLRPLAVASPGAHFAGPYTCDPAQAGIGGERWRHARAGEPFTELGATITPVPSAHTELEGAGSGYAFLGYVIEWNGVTVYHAGDTVIWDGLIEALSAWRIDVAFLPINGRDYFRTRRGIVGNMGVREAAELAEVLNVGLVVPTHYDLFAGNGADPGQFVSYLYRLNPDRPQKVLRVGELLSFIREG
ncbi:MBL fold metallo-hydrolase [Deinococcus apachensis]|uniref:MBL fold metallo-hydrolase n=1 Tax=Deinococcus apachensis TaxID=309886 RepID=UPI000371E8A5|nr:MBL fold metallo-hydrolase [Deinococcus apachensis]